jgi:hypothetical protein
LTRATAQAAGVRVVGDCLGATAVSSYCPRARAGAAVATPLAWDEEKAGLKPASFTVTTIPARLERMKTDPWQGFTDLAQELPEVEAPRPPAAPVAKARSAAQIIDHLRASAETAGLNLLGQASAARPVCSHLLDRFHGFQLFDLQLVRGLP